MGVIAFVAFSQADVEDEALSEKADIEYRISFKTKDVTPAGADFTDAETAQRALSTSTGKFTIEIIGADGTTGPQDLIDHPSMTQQDPPNGPWEVEPGMVQVAKITAPEVGDITEIRIEGDNNDKWSPGWVKVNSNDFHSGLGNESFTPVSRTASKWVPHSMQQQPGTQSTQPTYTNAWHSFAKRLSTGI